MKKCGILVAFVLLFAIILSLLLPVHGEEEIYDSVIRLHILANSDSEEDQALKLQVRDALLAESTGWFDGCTSQEDAEAILREKLDEIKEIAETALEKSNCSDPVSVTLDWEDYPERSYDAICFPSGQYLSLKVMIGDAEGHNWWCCLFPSLCLGAASVSAEKAADAFIEVGLTPSQYRIITETEKPTYKIRFKILELFQK